MLMPPTLFPHQVPALAKTRVGIASSSSSSASTATGWRLLAVASVLSIWIVTKLLESETLPKVHAEEGEEGFDTGAADKGRKRRKTSGWKGWWGARGESVDEEQEEDDAAAEDGREARAEAWAELEHAFSVFPDEERARQLVELARMRREEARRLAEGD
ncbi:hypothetical protein NSK_007467 [Nannochloropsis salina CCMP1776]|uniref:Uncharacterized protein n=1 Tax=Nannochloropsis salina CCMP1776 TaxID=1027361 RepID=A0A4D9CX99_9STRA|nr:hypothetical protein NSK_007467 [Nannochloropsis salina CCMP1776]|eukprot:TFJ81199.1 hypothetical protein NSK_007467 [Nannochloropsis salina CCMP1776]